METFIDINVKIRIMRNCKNRARLIVRHLRFVSKKII